MSRGYTSNEQQPIETSHLKLWKRSHRSLMIIGIWSGGSTGAHNPNRDRLYVIGGQGYVDVLHVSEKTRLTSIAHVATARGARTGLFVPEWNKLLVAAPRRGANPARLLVYTLTP